VTVSIVNVAKKEQLLGNATNVEKTSNQSPGTKKKPSNRESFLNQTEPLLHEKDDDSKANPKKLAHQNTMPKVVENDGDNEGEDESQALPSDNAINKT